MNRFFPVPDYPSREYLLGLHRHFSARLDELCRLNMADPMLDRTLRDFEAYVQHARELVEEIAVRLSIEQTKS